MQTRISIIGAGKLGLSLAKGWIRHNNAFRDTIILSDPALAQHHTEPQTGCRVATHNTEALSEAEIIIVAVKPQQAAAVLQELQGQLRSQQLLLSVVMGLSIESMATLTGGHGNLCRAMPNIAAAVGQSMSCLAFADSMAHENRQRLLNLFACLGEVMPIDEKLVNAATVMSGSGIAFALRYLRAMMQAGITIGFDSAAALQLAVQVARSATELLAASGLHPEQEIDKVTTPNGCTIAGLNEMEKAGLSTAVVQGVAAAYRRITG